MNILEICLACIVIVVFATCPNTASESKRRDARATSNRQGDPYVEGANQDVVKAVVAWIGTEMVIYNTPMCYRRTYDRGVGTLPSTCPPGKVMHAGLCYDVCSPGFSDHSTPTCTRDCPSGYTDTGLTCHYNGQGSYSPVHWDGCKSRAPKWLGGGCIGGLTEDSCRAGYNKVLSMCYINVPPGFSGSGLDPMKTGTYSRTGRLPECTSDKENSAGLCYPKPRDGYQCSLTACQKQCAAGTSACGVAACAVDTKSCAMGIVDMVMAPLDIIMNIATAGAAGKAVKGATDAGKIAANAKRLEKTASAMEKAGYASTALAASEAFAAQIEAIMNAAENDLASVTNSDIANQVMAKYPKGSLNYQGIVRLWTSVYLAQSNQDLADAMRDIVLSTIDPTGVVGVIQAYNKPMCGEHAPIP